MKTLSPFNDAVAVWHMASADGVTVHGDVALGVPLEDAEREASLTRGGDGRVVHLVARRVPALAQPVRAPAPGRAIDAEVFPVGERLLLYFATRDPAMKVQMIGVAAADRRSDFGRDAWKQLWGAPILKPELPWERNCIEASSLIRRRSSRRRGWRFRERS